jgi:hypothetical protein
VASQPGANVGAGGHDARASLASVPQGGADQGIAHTFPPSRRRDLGVLQIEHVFRELAVEQLGRAVGQVRDEARALAIVADADGLGITFGCTHPRNLRADP